MKLPRKYVYRPSPRCSCGKLADRFLGGWWVCLKCYPWNWKPK